MPTSAATARDIDLPAVLADRYGLTVRDVRPLQGELDANSAVQTADGQRYLVKASTDFADRAHLHWQHRLLEKLADPQFAIPAPRLVRSLVGADMEVTDRHGTPVLLRVYEWLPGTTVSELVHQSPQLLGEWGALAARLVRALADEWVPDGVRSTHRWDLLRAPELIAEQLDSVTDPVRIGYVETILGWHREIVAPVLDQLPRGVVHHDLNDFNVLVQADQAGVHHVAGVIDFTDTLASARITELAIAGGYAMLRKADPVAAFLAVVDGYAAVQPLDDLELRVLYPLAALRLALNVVTWTHRSQRTEDAAYGLSRSRHTWAALAAVTPAAPSYVESAVRHRLGA